MGIHSLVTGYIELAIAVQRKIWKQHKSQNSSDIFFMADAALVTYAIYQNLGSHIRLDAT